MTLFIFTVQLMSAFPVRSQWITVNQSDGTSLRLTLCGDEHFHYYKSEDGAVMLRNASGDYCYATATGFSLRNTGVIAHEVWKRTPDERPYVTMEDQLTTLKELVYKSVMEKDRTDAAREAASAGMTCRAKRAGQRLAATGGLPKRGLVIMVSFSDLDFSSTKSEWNDILNKVGYTNVAYDCPGSVHDYFYEQSSGKFNVSFDVVQVKLPKSKYYYGENFEYGGDKNAGEMV